MPFLGEKRADHADLISSILTNYYPGESTPIVRATLFYVSPHMKEYSEPLEGFSSSSRMPGNILFELLVSIQPRHGRQSRPEKEKALGPDHILTLLTVNNLGNLYQGQSKLAEAERMYSTYGPSSVFWGALCTSSFADKAGSTTPERPY